MVVQSTLNNLKEKPHDEKKAVASSIAIGVVILLLVGWGFLFIRKIQRGTATPVLESGVVPTDQFDAAFLRSTQDKINQLNQNSSQELQEIRDAAASNQAGGSVQQGESVNAESDSTQFGL